MRETVWYRIVGRRRTRREEVLNARSGRFHEDPAAEPTAHLGESLETVWRECQSARAGEARLDPGAFAGWRVTIRNARFVDFRESADRRKWKVGEGELLGDPAPARCREAARAVRRSPEGMDGIVYRSLRRPPKGVCLALFLEKEGVIAKFEPVPKKEWNRFVQGLKKK